MRVSAGADFYLGVTGRNCLRNEQSCIVVLPVMTPYILVNGHQPSVALNTKANVLAKR
jgi:hypothetical protein